MLSKKYNSNKLFYDTYLYKLQVRTNVSSVFRAKKNKEICRDKLDNLIKLSGPNKDSVKISRYKIAAYESIMSANHIMNELQDTTEAFKVRCESYSLIIYTNDMDLLDRIVINLDDSANCKIWKPIIGSEQFLLTNRGVSVSKNPVDFKFRCFLKHGTHTGALINWIKNNPDKAKIGSSTLRSLEHGYYVTGNYFYVKDEKILMMAEMVGGKLISKIEKIVHIDDLDK
jgi:hypothetical protein